MKFAPLRRRSARSLKLEFLFKLKIVTLEVSGARTMRRKYFSGEGEQDNSKVQKVPR